jgi:hypothetical protein
MRRLLPFLGSQHSESATGDVLRRGQAEAGRRGRGEGRALASSSGEGGVIASERNNVAAQRHWLKHPFAARGPVTLAPGRGGIAWSLPQRRQPPLTTKSMVLRINSVEFLRSTAFRSAHAQAARDRIATTHYTAMDDPAQSGGG